MTRILVQRGSTGSSSNQNRLSSLPGSSSASTPQSGALDESLDCCGSGDEKTIKNDEFLPESIEGLRNETALDEFIDKEKAGNSNSNEDAVDSSENEGPSVSSAQIVTTGSQPSPPPPPPPVPPPKPSIANLSSRRTVSGGSNAVQIGSSRRAVAWPVVLTQTSSSGSRPSSPRSFGEAEGYNSADEQNPCFGPSFDDAERERQFEIDIRRAKSLEVKRMLEDGNCLFRAVADQVYGDTEAYDLIRQMCMDYMCHSCLQGGNSVTGPCRTCYNPDCFVYVLQASLEAKTTCHYPERERDHFSEFITEGFTSYCKRKRRDKVYGNNVEIQALSEMYNRPIHIYSYSTEPINTFQGSYNTDTPPIRLSYHRGNHYNSLVDPRRLTVGAGLGFSSLQGANIDKDQVKAAIRAQQDQQIDNALLAEGRFYSDLELTEKEIERMVMEASRAEYIADDKLKQQLSFRDSSNSSAEPSSSGARPSRCNSKLEGGRDTVLSSSMQMVLSMGFGYLEVMEAYSKFGDDVESMVFYLLETGSSSRRKGKATE